MACKVSDPCSHARDTTQIGIGPGTARTRSAGQPEPSLQPLEPRTPAVSGVKEGRAASQGVGCRGMDPNGSTAPPRRFQGRPEPRTSRPYSYGDPRRSGSWQQGAPRPYPQDRKPQVRPRRGPPVAAIRVPRWYQHDEWETRQPQAFKPRGTQRGGPERPADDPRRNPRGGLCGGPGRSAKEPQTPSQTSHGKTNGGNAGKPKGKDERRPTIITVEGNGQERSWGPLSEINAWRAGFFWLEGGRK